MKHLLQHILKLFIGNYFKLERINTFKQLYQIQLLAMTYT